MFNTIKLYEQDSAMAKFQAKVLDWTGNLVNGATWQLMGDDASSSGINLRATEKEYWIIPVGTLIIFR